MAPLPLRPRVDGVDVARALASAIMIVGHANDAFVAAHHKSSLAYSVIALFQSLPLPAFLVLAGAAVALRVNAAEERAERGLRRVLVQRGLTIVAYGYLVSLAYALIDGSHGLDTLLRADVLHVIGLSIAALGLGAGRLPWVVALAVIPIALCPWLSPLGAHAHGPWRYFFALFVDVAPVTAMPFVPLASWAAIGALAAMAMLRTKSAGRAGASIGFLSLLAIGSVAVAAIAYAVMSLLLAVYGGPLSRAHPAVWANAIDLAARGLLVLAIGALASLRAPLRAAVIRFGRGSLVAYVVHIPFCYGRFGEPLRGQLDPLSASAIGLALVALAWLAVWTRDELRQRWQWAKNRAK